MFVFGQHQKIAVRQRALGDDPAPQAEGHQAIGTLEASGVFGVPTLATEAWRWLKLELLLSFFTIWTLEPSNNHQQLGSDESYTTNTIKKKRKNIIANMKNRLRYQKKIHLKYGKVNHKNKITVKLVIQVRMSKAIKHTDLYTKWTIPWHKMNISWSGEQNIVSGYTNGYTVLWNEPLLINQLQQAVHVEPFHQLGLFFKKTPGKKQHIIPTNDGLSNGKITKITRCKQFPIGQMIFQAAVGVKEIIHTSIVVSIHYEDIPVARSKHKMTWKKCWTPTKKSKVTVQANFAGKPLCKNMCRKHSWTLVCLSTQRWLESDTPCQALFSILLQHLASYL